MLLQLTLQVPLISAMDRQLLDVICEHMTYFLCTESTYIICEADPIKVMLFIVRGKLESSTTDVGRLDFFNSVNLKLGDFYGEELLVAEHLEGRNRKKKMGGSRSRRCNSSILKSQWADQDREGFDLGVKIKKGEDLDQENAVVESLNCNG
jgi:hypothetical protein